MEADRSRLWRTYLWSIPTWVVLSIPVNRAVDDPHKELRELLWWQVVAVVVGMSVAAGSVWVSAEYGPWSWWAPARAFQRHVAVVLLGFATVCLLYAVSLAFR